MATLAERKANIILLPKTIARCANGNKDAEEYLIKIAYVSRVFDDLIDKDYVVPDENICRAFYILLAELWMNPFFKKHSETLIPLHIASYNAFMDSNKWAESGDTLREIYAHVIKDFINELLGVVAFLVGGYNHMRITSLNVKEAHLEEV